MYDKKAIEEDIRRNLFFLAILFFTFLILFAIRLVTKDIYKKMVTEQNVASESLGSITVKEKTEPTGGLAAGNLTGNLQQNLMQGTSFWGGFAGRPGQVAFSGNLLFWSEKIENQFVLKIKNTSSGKELFSEASPFPNKFLQVLPESFLFVREEKGTDRVYVLKNGSFEKEDITPLSISDGVRLFSLVTDGKNLYFTDQKQVFSSDINGENLTVLLHTKKPARIVCLKDYLLYLDDGENLFSSDVLEKNVSQVFFHPEASAIFFLENRFLVLEKSGTILSYQNGELLEKKEISSSAASVYGDSIYYAVQKDLFRDLEKIFEADAPIVSIYFSEKQILVFDVYGKKYEIAKKTG